MSASCSGASPARRPPPRSWPMCPDRPAPHRQGRLRRRTRHRQQRPPRLRRRPRHPTRRPKRRRWHRRRVGSGPHGHQTRSDPSTTARAAATSTSPPWTAPAPAPSKTACVTTNSATPPPSPTKKPSARPARHGSAAHRPRHRLRQPPHTGCVPPHRTPARRPRLGPAIRAAATPAAARSPHTNPDPPPRPSLGRTRSAAHHYRKVVGTLEAVDGAAAWPRTPRRLSASLPRLGRGHGCLCLETSRPERQILPVVDLEAACGAIEAGL